MKQSAQFTVSFPEHEKLRAVKDRSQAIGEFMEWLAYERGIILGEHITRLEDGTLDPSKTYEVTEFVVLRASIVGLLAEFFDIDQAKLEAEKRVILEELQTLKAIEEYAVKMGKNHA